MYIWANVCVSFNLLSPSCTQLEIKENVVQKLLFFVKRSPETLNVKEWSFWTHNTDTLIAK